MITFVSSKISAAQIALQTLIALIPKYQGAGTKAN
jgi:hypothetical protein